MRAPIAGQRLALLLAATAIVLALPSILLANPDGFGLVSVFAAALHAVFVFPSAREGRWIVVVFCFVQAAALAFAPTLVGTVAIWPLALVAIFRAQLGLSGGLRVACVALLVLAGACSAAWVSVQAAYVPSLVLVAFAFFVLVLRPQANASDWTSDSSQLGLPVMACRVSQEGTLLNCNDVVVSRLGYSRDELVGHSVLETICAPKSAEDVRRILSSWRSTGALRIEDQELEVQCKDGSSFPISLTSRAVKGETSSLSILYDISKRVSADEAKSAFVSTVSHELRTPLTSIRGTLGMLEGNVIAPIPDKALRLIEVARRNTDRLVRIINDILDLQRVSDGQFELEKSVLDARSLVDLACDSVRSLAETSEISLVTRVEAAVGFPGDSDRLVQVLVNLLGNAIKFSPADSKVIIGAKRSGDSIRFWVKDEGPGIERKDWARIFGNFEQADSKLTRARGGTGLGLTIASKIVELHGGEIGLTSEQDAGSEFFFTLPCT